MATWLLDEAQKCCRSIFSQQVSMKATIPGTPGSSWKKMSMNTKDPIIFLDIVARRIVMLLWPHHCCCYINYISKQMWYHINVTLIFLLYISTIFFIYYPFSHCIIVGHVLCVKKTVLINKLPNSNKYFIYCNQMKKIYNIVFYFKGPCYTT